MNRRKKQIIRSHKQAMYNTCADSAGRSAVHVSRYFDITLLLYRASKGFEPFDALWDQTCLSWESFVFSLRGSTSSLVDCLLVGPDTSSSFTCSLFLSSAHNSTFHFSCPLSVSLFTSLSLSHSLFFLFPHFLSCRRAFARHPSPSRVPVFWRCALLFGPDMIARRTNIVIYNDAFCHTKA